MRSWMKRWVLLGAVLTTGLSGAALGAAPAEPPKDEVRKLNFEGDTISTDGHRSRIAQASSSDSSRRSRISRGMRPMFTNGIR